MTPITEKEARGKFCPVMSSQTYKNNSGGDYQEPQNCCASDCMAWRVVHHELSDETQNTGVCELIDASKRERWSISRESR